MQIRPRYLLIYERLEGLPPRTAEARKISLEALHARAAYDGLLNFNSIKRLKRAIELLVATATEKEAVNFKTGKKFRFKVNFVTLTLPAPQKDVTDKQLKRYCLDVWIKAAKRLFKLNNYVWRAERQKNGNLHFHLCTDVYMPYDQLRDSWNQRLGKFHFVKEYTARHSAMTFADYLQAYPVTDKSPIEKRKEAYRRGVNTNWLFPNSTDVHSVNNVKDLAAYMVKYMAKLKKNEQRIDGKVWDCSKNLKRKDSVEFIIDNEVSNMINEAIEIHGCRGKVTDHCTMVFLNDQQFKKVVTGRFAQAYNEWLKSIR